MRHIAVNPELAGCHGVLEDIDPAALEVKLPVARKVAGGAGSGKNLSANTSREEGLDGAE